MSYPPYPPSDGQHGAPYPQPSPYPQPQPGGYPQPQQGGYPQPQQGGYPQPQQGGYPQPQPGGYPQPQPGGYPQPQPGGYPPPQPASYPESQPGGYPQPNQSVYPNPIVQQPTQAGPQQPMMGVANCLPELQCLLGVDHILIKQKREILEALTTFETANKYEIRNAMGQQIFTAKEDTDCCTRNMCGPRRPFDMKIKDNYKTEIIHLNRPLACSSCFFPCCLQSIEVSSPPGNIIGYVEQDWSILTPSFTIKNASKDDVLKIEGPMCTYSLCGAVEFQVLSADGSTQVGKISKEWSGVLNEVFTDADNFGISFPMDLDVNMKAVMMGAAFLIDYMFFEKKGHQESDGIGMLG